ncbi:MAG TPA: cereblon family protein [Dongiaceae bacterium]|nr:cereblon family protein [Dongiaceae bacterium]
MDCLEINPPKTVLDWLPLTQSDDETAKKKSVVRCRCCRAYITESQFLIPVDGECIHFFKNPIGQGFDIQTYVMAEGCIVSGKPTEFFTWFPGHAWQYAYCKDCNNHLGWYYTCDGMAGFYGLIIDQLLLE